MAKPTEFAELGCTTELRAAARTVLAARLETVERFLACVARSPQPRSEDVHQLRVASRRLVAALAAFKPCLNPEQRRRLRRLARRMRRDAGAVRDLDIQRGTFAELAARLGLARTRGVQQFRRTLGARRDAAGASLARLAARKVASFGSAADEARGELRSDAANGASHPFGHAAERELRRRLERFRAAGQHDVANLDNAHQLRVRTKGLRYALELFGGCFPDASVQELHGELVAMQNDLGEINDLRNLGSTLATKPRRDRPGGAPRPIDRLGDAIRRDLAARRRRLRAEAEARRQLVQRLERLLPRRAAAARQNARKAARDRSGAGL